MECIQWALVLSLEYQLKKFGPIFRNELSGSAVSCAPEDTCSERRSILLDYFLKDRYHLGFHFISSLDIFSVALL